MARIRCADCGTELDLEQGDCPACGAVDCLIDQVIDSGVRIEESLDLKGRHGEPGSVRPYLRKTIKREYSFRKGRQEEVERTFDHDAGTYVEEYRDVETGEVTFREAGRITDQSLHGRRPSTVRHHD
jgi:hypothetical protein